MFFIYFHELLLSPELLHCPLPTSLLQVLAKANPTLRNRESRTPAEALSLFCQPGHKITAMFNC